ncbi:MAG: hypothetical protein HC905_20005 [Bacteroidales bacterium]|nr:hypothetical protein [Bacteroidales bacterium]
MIAWDEGGTTPPSSHWLVNFDAGATNEGSSGAPLFSKQKRIIGQLHGGGDGEEFYGKLNYSWNNSTSGYKQLKTYLDPTNSGVKTLDGYTPDKIVPDAFFSTPFKDICLNFPVVFNDYSAFSPASREWIITPTGYKFVNGTDKNSQNPNIEFTKAGNYNVKLRVSNNNGKDSLQINNVITAGNSINVSMLSDNESSFCYYNFDSLVLSGYGAENYTWEIEKQTVEPFYISQIFGDTAILKAKNNVIIDSTYKLQVKVTGTQGTCTNTSTQTFDFIKVFNDNIVNAIEIKPGTTKSFSNFVHQLKQMNHIRQVIHALVLSRGAMNTEQAKILSRTVYGLNLQASERKSFS